MTGKNVKKQLISNKLFKTYAMLFGVIFLATLIFFTIFLSVKINTDIVATQKQMINNISENINNYFTEINDFSMDLISHKEFKEISINDLPKLYEEGREYSYAFNRLYNISHKMFQKSYKVGVYTKSDYFMWLGSDFFFNKSNDPGLDNFVNYRDNGVMHIERYNENIFVKNVATSERFETELKDSVCLWRTMSTKNFLGNGEAILQIEVDGKDFDTYMQRLSSHSNMESLSLSLFDKNGVPLYTENDFDIKPFIKDNNIMDGEYNLNGNIVTIKPVLHENLYVAFTIPNMAYYSQLFIFIGITLISGVFILLLIMFITYKISKKLSKPINKIIDQVTNIDIERFKKVETEIYEIDFLAETISELHSNLDDSINQIVNLKSAEVHSKMLALQAQMQPHFLYNVLMTISAIAEEKGNMDVASMCNNLTSMLRYISSDNEHGVPIYEEIKHLNNYIDVMKERFPNATVHIDVPIELMNVFIPKLVIQPIVENSFKYSNCSNLRISVVGHRTENGFFFNICDNGEGFSEDVIRRIGERCARIESDRNNLSISGMGLINIFMRLKMFYGENAIFEIKNIKEGTCIRIGTERSCHGTD